MGLLDLAESVLGANGGGTGASSSNVLSAVLGALNNHPGGLDGVTGALSQGGLADVVSSWVSNGPNPPVTAGQLQGVLGSGPIQEIASKLGVSPDMAGSVLSQLLPHIVDHLTPGGQMPASGLASGGSDLIGQVLGGFFGAGR